MDKTNRYQKAKSVTLVGACVNIILCIVKVVTGVLAHSHALVADGVHSAADLFTDVMVIIGSKYSSQEADDSHPYGHQRIETATTLFLSLVLILAGCGIAWDAFIEILHHTHEVPKLLSLPIAILSIITNEGLFHYTHYIGKQIQSPLIIANAWHRRSDAASSLVVLIGIIGSIVGYKGFDAVAAIIVSLMVIKMGWNYGWDSVKELVDTAIDPQTRQQIEEIIQNIDGVVKIHQLRSRSMGQDVFIDVHIQVAPFITVSEGHYIAQHVHYALLNQFKTIKDVTVHVDPEDDEAVSPAAHLINRTTLENKLLLPWQARFPEIQYWMLHYLEGSISIDLYCREPIHPDLYPSIQEDLKQYPQLANVKIYFIHDLNRVSNTNDNHHHH